LKRDSAGFIEGLNVYIYSSNDSINYLDPLGLNKIKNQCRAAVLERPLDLKFQWLVKKLPYHYNFQMQLSTGRVVTYGFFAKDFMSAFQLSLKFPFSSGSRWLPLKSKSVVGYINKVREKFGVIKEIKCVDCSKTDRKNRTLMKKVGKEIKQSYNLILNNCRRWAKIQYDSLGK
jgi:hypothetical protein